MHHHLLNSGNIHLQSIAVSGTVLENHYLMVQYPSFGLFVRESSVTILKHQDEAQGIKIRQRRIF